MLSRTGGSATSTTDGNLLLYLGNGTFQSTGFPQLGLLVGDAGTDVVTLAAADVDADGDVNPVAGRRHRRADVAVFRNGDNDALGYPLWTASTVISAATLSPPPSRSSRPTSPRRASCRARVR